MIFDSYKVKADHRNKAKLKEKSQWEVNEWMEVYLFSLAQKMGWHKAGENFLWSLSADEGKLEKLGFDADGELYLAKYRCDAQNQWHGYPVSPRQFDIPPKNVIESWKEKGLVDNKTANRILQGKL